MFFYANILSFKFFTFAIFIYPKCPAIYSFASLLVISPLFTFSFRCFTFFFSFCFPLSLIFSLYSFILYPQKFTPCLFLNICVFWFSSNSKFSLRNSFTFSSTSFASSFVCTNITPVVHVPIIVFTF